MTGSFLFSEKSLFCLVTPQFPRIPKQNSEIDFSHPNVNIGNVFGQSTTVKFRKSIVNEIGIENV